ncbi:uncharacterized protein BO88DRAFT_108950 [Aspergillus vadensis CBS 113365]|uniref:Uncharacterized protein n=1 Tax=Aspergillus vadensis (strain CBS 113365 / IMI 142717 / IBT 24658) TaxID=1448311 RepID=A0A319C6C7_ASPVC|nr:hypothetical protein BO88DRAFT_108950 [Aspergillus vadensis CBS 113365]PYH73943.1 hypothetical protein BO88DRAFT_108950 [Aspergillus vadensis CBS 113365]
MLWSTEESKECVLHSSIEQKTQGMRVERRNDRASRRGRTVRWKRRGKEAGEKRRRERESICIGIGASGMYVWMDVWCVWYHLVWGGESPSGSTAPTSNNTKESIFLTLTLCLSISLSHE